MSNHDNLSARHSLTTLLLFALCAAVLFFSFVALGTWQMKRLDWKRNLIARG